jgi:hypothetical protein
MLVMPLYVLGLLLMALTVLAVLRWMGHAERGE